MLAIRKDPELNKYFKDGDFSEAGVMPMNQTKTQGKKKTSKEDDFSD